VKIQLRALGKVGKLINDIYWQHLKTNYA